MIRLFCVTMVIFIVQKPLFMLYNMSVDESVTVGDYLDVVWHGIPLDMTMTGYTLVMPWLLLTLSYFTGRNFQSWIRKGLAAYYVIISLLLALIFVADTVMYAFWHFKLDDTVFMYLDNPKGAFASVSTVFMLLATLVFCIIVAVYVMSLWSVLPRRALKSPRNRWTSLVMLPLGALLFLIIRGGVGQGTANVTKAYYCDNPYLNHSAVNCGFNLFYALAHRQNFSEEFRYYEDNERQALVNGMYHTESIEPDTLLRVKRPNIILIVWEGCGASITGCLGSSAGATPNLDRMAEEGILFSNCQANSFRTDRGLVSIFAGWLGLPTASLMRMQSKSDKLPGLAKALQREGYSTDFWYGGDISFTSMGAFMLQNGFQKTYDETDFSSNDRLTDWGVPDGILFDKVAADIEQRSGKEPFFISILTLSSHEPWEVPYGRLEDKVANSFAYTDDCIGRFVDRLRNSSLWGNTLVVIVPDHGALTTDALNVSSPEVMHIPLVMCGGAVKESREIKTLMNQSDIAATLLGQLGIDHDAFVFSRDVLGKSYTSPSAFHTSKTEFTYFDETGFTTVDLNSDKEIYGADDSGSRASKGRAVLQTLYEVVDKLNK